MVSKKYKFLLGILLLASGAFAQVGGRGSVYDSSVIPAKRMAQQNEFWNSTYNFPAKPRNMWEIGVSGGMFTVSGDVAAKLPTLGFAAHVRKAFGYVFSLRLQYLNGTGKGMNWVSSQNFGKNQGPLDQIYYNYKVKLQDLSLQGIVTLNNVRFHKQKTGMVVYGGAGIGISAFQTKVNALDASGNPYTTLFNSITTTNYSGRKSVLKALKAGMDKTYETDADNELTRRPKLGNNTLKPSGTVLVGLAFKLSNRINLAIEDRWSFVKTDLLDGQRWQEHAWGDAALTSDFDSYNYASIGLNVNLGAKSVQPLWWLNPLDYAYDELRNHRNVKIPKNDCNDADGDGVCDHLDREPNTPAGCPVDTHGVTRDTDGDGVPDCKDKQLITPTECQPVNADGVGKCPEPECCKNNAGMGGDKAVQCPCDYPSLGFKGNVLTLNADNRAMLATVAAKMKANPTCTITINGYPEASKASQANCQKRLDAIKKYLVEKEGISADRITTNCEVGGGDKNTVDVKCN